MAERATPKPVSRNPFVLSFAWIAVIGRLVRLRTFTGGFGDSGGSVGGMVLPWYCELDDPCEIKWLPVSMGLPPPCEIPAHGTGGRKMLLDVEETRKAYGIVPDLERFGQ